MLHVRASRHGKDLHVSGHLGVWVSLDVLLQTLLQLSQDCFDVNLGGGVLWVKVDQRLVQVRMFYFCLFPQIN